MDSVLSEPICIVCGICCDGTLFADVKITPEDYSRLAAAGAPLPFLRPSSKSLRLPQPCFALKGLRCSVYENRPGHCRKFNCALLSRQLEGEISREQALETIQRTVAKANEVRRLLALLGSKDERHPLSGRFEIARQMAEKYANDRNRTRLFGDLTVAMHELHCLLSEYFYPA